MVSCVMSPRSGWRG